MEEERCCMNVGLDFVLNLVSNLGLNFCLFFVTVRLSYRFFSSRLFVPVKQS